MKGAGMKKTPLFAITLFVCFFFVPEMSPAQTDYPNRPIQVLIGYAPGGSTDVLLRSLAQEARKYLGQEMLIINKPGAAGTAAASQVATARPDGYTLGASPSSTFTSAPFFLDLSIDLLKESTPIFSFAQFHVAILVKPDSPFNTLKDLLDYAKQNPGKVTYGHPGVSTRPHLVMAAIANHDGIKMNLMPFPGDAPTVTALLGGHVTAAGCSGGGWVPHVEAGTLRPLALTEQERSDLFPKIPTIVELGYPYPIPLVVFLHGPRGLPEPVVKKLEDAVSKASQTPVFKEVAAKNVLSAKKNMGREELSRFLQSEKEKTGDIVQKLGLAKK